MGTLNTIFMTLNIIFSVLFWIGVCTDLESVSVLRVRGGVGLAVFILFSSLHKLKISQGLHFVQY